MSVVADEAAVSNDPLVSEQSECGADIEPFDVEGAPWDLFYSVPASLAIFDGEGALIRANMNFCSLVGQAETVLVGSAMHELLIWRDPGQAFAECAMGNNEFRPATLRVLESNFSVDARCQRIDMNGLPYSLLTVQMPGPSREEGMLRAVINAVPTVTFLVRSNGEIVLSNAAAAILFGYEPGELEGMNVESLLEPQSTVLNGQHGERFTEGRFAGSIGRDGAISARRKDSTKLPVEIALHPLEPSVGEFILCTVTDTTERHAAEALSDQKTRRMEALNSDLSAFAYSASHDLKAPLSSISGLLAICIEDLDDGHLQDLRENLENAVEISRRSAHKVEAVLAIARVGHETIPAETFDPAREIMDIWRDLTGSMATPPDFRVDLSLPDLVHTERPTFNLVLENLLSNALRYGDASKERHRIRVSGILRDDRICLIVADNGLGIPMENQQRIFKMFDRIDDRSGDGMGLSLVRKQIERLGGAITVSSTPGAGAEFSFSLPFMVKGNK